MFIATRCYTHITYVKSLCILIFTFLLQSCTVLDNTTIAIDKQIFERNERNAGNYRLPPAGLKPIRVFVSSTNSPNVDKKMLDKGMLDWAVESLESYASRSKRFRVVNAARGSGADAELIVKIDKLTVRGENTKSSDTSGNHNKNKGDLKSSLTEEAQLYGAVSITLLKDDEKASFQGNAKLSSYKANNLFNVVLTNQKSGASNEESSKERADEVDYRRVIKVAVDRSVRKLINFVDEDFKAEELYSSN